MYMKQLIFKNSKHITELKSKVREGTLEELKGTIDRQEARNKKRKELQAERLKNAS